MVAVEELPEEEDADEPIEETNHGDQAAVDANEESIDGAPCEEGESDKPTKVNGVDPHARFAEGIKEKERGKQAYEKGNYEEAVDAWCMARGTFKHIVEREFFKDDPAKLEEVKQLQVQINLNLAQGCLKNKEFYQAVTHANKVLEVEPRNAKALYRKAAALIDASSFAEAKKTLELWLEVDPNNASAKQMLNDVARKAAASAKSGKKVAQKMMAGMERDPRTGLTTQEYAQKQASSLVEAILSIDFAAYWRYVTECQFCRFRRKKA